jgi:hypothetical protein
MMLLGEISELSLEPAIEGRFDESIFVVPSGVAKKYVDTFLGRQTLNTNQRRCPLHRGGRSARRGRTVRGLVRGAVVLSAQGRTVRAQGPDGPQPGVRLGLLPDSRTVRACAGAAEDRWRRLDLAPGRNPVGEERS